MTRPALHAHPAEWYDYAEQSDTEDIERTCANLTVLQRDETASDRDKIQSDAIMEIMWTELEARHEQ